MKLRGVRDVKIIWLLSASFFCVIVACVVQSSKWLILSLFAILPLCFRTLFLRHLFCQAPWEYGFVIGTFPEFSQADLEMFWITRNFSYFVWARNQILSWEGVWTSLRGWMLWTPSCFGSWVQNGHEEGRIQKILTFLRVNKRSCSGAQSGVSIPNDFATERDSSSWLTQEMISTSAFDQVQQ